MVRRFIGIDLGGTSVKFAILTFDGDILHKWSIETNTMNDGESIVPNIIESINDNLTVHNLAISDILGIGMGSPGAVNFENGTVIGAYNLGWKTLIRVKDQIEAAMGIPFFLDNDANVAALGELWKGAGEGDDNVVFMTLGTGIGGGVIVEARCRLHGGLSGNEPEARGICEEEGNSRGARRLSPGLGVEEGTHSED